ncbi:hypothetical protein C0583_03350 [Candidatus Parcubacteria bacterium]|nr:MAG: hypothetical protein C0583_03350 [Candidatus Parcubacteria bacterium]
MEYYFEIVFKGLNVNNIDDKRKAAGKILSIIQAIKNPIESAHWLKVLSEKILVDESVLKEAMPAKVPETVNNAVSNRTIQVKQEELSQAERISELFLSLLVKNFHFIDSMQANVSVEHIFGAKNKALYKNLLFYYNNPKLSSEQKKAILALDFNTFISWLEEYLLNKPNNNEQSTVIIKQQLEDQLNHLNRLVLLADKEYEGQEIDDLQSEINKLILSLKKESIQIRKKELENLISQAEKNNNEDDLDLYFQKLKQLTDEYNILNK